MGALIQTYEPVSPGFLQSIGAMFLLALLALAAAVLILWRARSLAYNYRTLLAMLCFFGATIALGNGFFMKITRGPIADFAIYEAGVVNGHGSFSYASFRDAYLYTDEQASLVDPQSIQQRLKVLVIELKDDRRMTFTEQHYPVEQILADIQDAYARYRENQ